MSRRKFLNIGRQIVTDNGPAVVVALYDDWVAVPKAPDTPRPPHGDEMWVALKYANGLITAHPASYFVVEPQAGAQ